jgi:hypothetical protein
VLKPTVTCSFASKPESPSAQWGLAKQAGSHALRAELPGAVWGQSSCVVPIDGFRQFASTFWYIKEHHTRGAAVWLDAQVEAECEKHHPAAREAAANEYKSQALGESEA